MPSDLYSGLLTLYAASSAVGMAYLALPDYRYRNTITEYLEHQVRYKFNLAEEDQAETVRSEVMPLSEVEATVRRCVARHRNKPAGEPEWLVTLRLMLYLPRGHVPTELESLKERRKKDQFANWFQKVPGQIFRRLYLTHWDNKIVTALAMSSLMITVLILWDIVFINSPDFNQTSDILDKTKLGVASDEAQSTAGLIGSYKKAFFYIGVAGLVVPAALAAIGRLIVCPLARQDIDVAVSKLMFDAVDAQSNEFHEQATANQEAVPNK